MDALARFEAYLVDHPTDRFSLYGRALELKKAGRLDDAVEGFERLLAAHPTSGAGFYQYGELLMEAERLEEARGVVERGLEALASEKGADARRSLAELRGLLDDIDLA